MHQLFEYRAPVQPSDFIGRRSELDQVYDSLVCGASAAIVGEPRIGKTSILDYVYLQADEVRSTLHSRAPGTTFFFSHIEAHGRAGIFDEAGFWQDALLALEGLERAAAQSTSLLRPVRLRYRECLKKAFSVLSLERLFSYLHAACGRLVVLVDEFDTFIHDRTCDPQFFARIRSLNQNVKFRGAFMLLVTSRSPLSTLEAISLDRGFTGGSPPFNHMTEIELGAFSSEEIDDLLERAGNRFSKEDRLYLSEVSGGYPYLVQVAAATFLQSDRRRTADTVISEARRMLSEVWRHWSAQMRFAFACVMVCHLEHLLGVAFAGPAGARTGKDLMRVGTELRQLVLCGFVAPNADVPGGHRIRATAFLAWGVTDLARSASSLEALRGLGWENVLSVGEQRVWTEIFRAMAEVTPAQRQGLIDPSDAVRGGPTVQGSPVPAPVALRRKTSGIQVFISYVCRDEEALVKLRTALAPMESAGRITTWWEGLLTPGSPVQDTILARLRAAHIVLLLISAEYVASDRHVNEELVVALRRQERGDVVVIPIVIRPTDWKHLPIGKLRALPSSELAITQWPDHDLAWLDVRRGIQSVVESLGA